MPSRNCDLQRSLSHRCCGNRIINVDNFWEMYNTSTILTLLNGEMREMEKNLNMWQLSAECCEEYIKQKKRFLQLFQSSWQGFLKKLKRLPKFFFKTYSSELFSFKQEHPSETIFHLFKLASLNEDSETKSYNRHIAKTHTQLQYPCKKFQHIH